MSFINYSSREINCKIVYYGPGLCGKTTNQQYIYSKTNPDVKGKMISLATETERTLFFDFLPLALGQIRGFKTRFHLYTVPGQVFYDASRKLILKGVDGVVFVADSQIERMEANSESLDNLRVNLKEQGYELDKIPYVIQHNKRDLPNAAPLEEMQRLINGHNVPSFEACATVGKGVFETEDFPGRETCPENWDWWLDLYGSGMSISSATATCRDGSESGHRMWGPVTTDDLEGEPKRRGDLDCSGLSAEACKEAYRSFRDEIHTERRDRIDDWRDWNDRVATELACEE